MHDAYIYKKPSKVNLLLQLMATNLQDRLKAALLDVFILSMDQITLCNLTGVTRSDKPTENITWLCSSPQCCSIFSSLFWFCCPQLYCFGSLSWFSSALFPVASYFQLFSAKSSDIPIVTLHT